MKTIIAAISLAAIFGVTSVAHAGFMESAFGNTVSVADGEGTIMASFEFSEDGSFVMTQSDGQSGVGTWTIDGNNMCLSVGENEECHEVRDISVGESWSDTNEDGSTTVISIVSGR